MSDSNHHKLHVSSEVGLLRKVIIHRPDDGIELVTPDKALEYLYDDIVYLKKMKEEHDVFTALLRHFIGNANVIDIEELLSLILTDKKVKEELISNTCSFEDANQHVALLQTLNPKALAYTLITGYIQSEQRSIFPPISNFIFCRDIGVMINEHVLVCEASKKARSRESLLFRFVAKHAGLFRSNNIIEVSSLNLFLENSSNNDKAIAIEGGDVMMIHPDHLLIGQSERTTLRAIEHLAEILLSKNIVKHVTRVNIPKDRYCMHLDTIFTIINRNECVAFEPLICVPDRLEVVQYSSGMQKRKISSLKEMILEVYPDMKFIPCGGGVSPHAEREQWTDGCNLFSIKPSVALTYDRNHRTARALQEQGYILVQAKKLLAQLKEGKIKAEDIHKTIILIPSNELSRARGGTHCLTFPISRNTIL